MKITQQFKTQLYNYFVKRLGAYEYRNGWLRVPVCPYCGREQKMGVNLTTYRTNCFRCGEHPSPAQMVMDIETLDTYAELLTFLKHGDFSELSFTETKVELAEPKPVYLPDGFRLINQGTSTTSKVMQSYVNKRGFDTQQLSKLGVGYCAKGDYMGYLILPFYSQGRLTYFNARLVIGNGPRYNNPPKSVTGLGKEFLIYNVDALELYNQIYICEGVFNALTMGERAIATMGKAVSAVQVNKLIKSPARKFILLLDPDAIKQAISLALKLINFKAVKIIRLPEGKDANDLGRKEVMKLVWKTRYMYTYQEVINFRNNYRYEEV